MRPARWIPALWAFVFATAAAAADTGPILYLGTGFSIAGEQDTRITDSQRPTPPANFPVYGGADFDIYHQDAALAEVGLGWRVAPHVRVELNANYRDHRVDNIKYLTARGDTHYLAGMANVYVDYPLGRQVEKDDLPILLPYAGVGVGVLWSKSRAEFDYPYVASTASPLIRERKIRGESAEFAWNVMLGTQIPISRHFALDLGYRYLESRDHRWMVRQNVATSGGGDSQGVGAADGAYQTHEGRIGLIVQY